VIYLGLLRGEFDNDLTLQATEEYARAAHAEEAPALSRNPLRWVAAGILSLWFALRWLGWQAQVAAAQGRARAKAVLASEPTALPTQAPSSKPLSNDSSQSAAAPTLAETLVGEVGFAEEGGDKVQAVMETNSESMLESMTESVAEGPDLATPATSETPVPPALPQVFISYQRGDRDTAVKLYAQLQARFPGQVFTDTALQPGADWNQALTQALQSAAVVLVLVGPDWKTDARRYAEAEVAAALQGGKVVVPVLINGASLPRASALPPSLRGLVTRQALTLPELGFEQAVEMMANELVQWLRPPTGSKGASKAGEHK
jgi:TIR domain